MWSQYIIDTNFWWNIFTKLRLQYDQILELVKFSTIDTVANVF